MNFLKQVFVVFVLISLSLVARAQISNGLMYQRLTGLPAVGDLEGLEYEQVFEKAFTDSNFLDNRILTLVSRLSVESADPYGPIGTYQAAIALGIVQNIDFRSLFDQPIWIVSNETANPVTPRLAQLAFTLASLDGFSNLPSEFRLFTGDPFTEISYDDGKYEGLFTTPEFGEEFIQDGTNRKPIRGIYDIFLCSKIESYKDASLDTFFIGQDIDRVPGDHPQVFQEECSACHAPLDGQRPAFAYQDYQNNRMMLLQEVSEKYNRNSRGYGGLQIVSDHWENPLVTPVHQERFGWRTPTTGRGVGEFAHMIVNSEQFSRCMVQKTAAEFCDLPMDFVQNDAIAQVVQSLATRFEVGEYRFLNLIKDIVRSPLCE